MAKLWKQVRLVTIGELLFDYEDIDVEFEVKCTDDNKADMATIRIYNLSETTKNKIQADQVVIIDSGYRELHEVIFGGVVETVSTNRIENDIVTTITASPNNRAYTNTPINIQFKSGIKASEVLKQIGNMIPFKIDIKELVKDPIYPNGKVFSNRLSNVISVLARDTGTIARFTNNFIEFKAPGKAYSQVLKLGSEQGLVRVDKKEEKTSTEKEEKNSKKKKDSKKEKPKYNIEALLVPLVKIGQFIEIESTLWSGKGIVKECEYIARDVSNFSVNAVLEVVE